MSFSFTDDVGDGITTTFIFGFTGPDSGYLRNSDIVVEIDGIPTTAFTLTGVNSLEMDVAPADLAIVRIRRVMPTDTPYSDFTRGNAFGQRNINFSFLQQLYTTHSHLDGFRPADYYEKQNLNMGESQIINLGPVVNPGDVTDKAYVDANNSSTESAAAAASAADALASENSAAADAVQTGLDVLASSSSSATASAAAAEAVAAASGIRRKDNAKTATVSNITLSGEQTLDGILTSSDRVLVKDQTLPAENGVYLSAAGAWSRTSDMNDWVEVPNATVAVEQGTINADINFQAVSDSGGVIGVTDMVWVSVGGGDLKSSANLSDLSNAAIAFGNIKQSATDTDEGVVELADQSETDAGTSTTTVVRPNTLKSLTLAAMDWFIDEDDMVSDDASKIPSQQSVKAYVDANGGLTRIANQATTSGTEKTFSIGAGATYFQLGFTSHSMTGSLTTVRLGDSGGREDTGYIGSKSALTAGANTTTSSTDGCTTNYSGAVGIMNGTVTGTLLDPATNTWSIVLALGASNTTIQAYTAVSKSLSGELETVHVMAVDGTSTHDLGSIGGFWM